MNKRTKRIYDRFPGTTKDIMVGDIWFAYFPYLDNNNKKTGNMEKIRPVYVKEILESGYKVCYITSNPNKGRYLDIELSKKRKYKFLNKKSYINEKIETIITIDKFYGLLKRNIKIKEE